MKWLAVLLLLIFAFLISASISSAHSPHGPRVQMTVFRSFGVGPGYLASQQSLPPVGYAPGVGTGGCGGVVPGSAQFNYNGAGVFRAPVFRNVFFRPRIFGIR